jgi:radical SAM protein with 4Fe4S-binding SPASM domain
MKDVGIKIVSLSLDGPTRKIHDDFRGQVGAFDGVMKAIELFKKHNIPFLINSSFTKRNQMYIRDVYKLVKEIKPVAWYLFMIVPVGRGEELFEELISPKDYEDILRWHFEMELEEKEIFVRPTCAPQYYRICYEMSKEKSIKYERRNLKFSTGGAKGCVAAQLIAMIDAYGNVKPCSYFPLSAGNIKEKSFRKIWYQSKLFNDLRDFKSYKDRCGVCEYLNVCGGCRARAYTATGDYMEVDPYCNYIPRRYRERKNG